MVGAATICEPSQGGREAHKDGSVHVAARRRIPFLGGVFVGSSGPTFLYPKVLLLY